MPSRLLRWVCERPTAFTNQTRRTLIAAHVNTGLSSRPRALHRCSSLCPLHHALPTAAALASSSSPSRLLATAAVSRNPLPRSSSGHTRSGSIGDHTFHPADPEVEGFKTRLSVERRVYSAITSLPKLRDSAVLQAARPPVTSLQVDQQPVGHDDPLAAVRLDSLDLDSLDKVELLTAVEKEFNVQFTDEQFEQFAAVGDIIESLLWNPHAK